MAGRAFALLGPTASGKSTLALALAERLPMEIVSMDSAQVYRGLDIGTAKPSAEERARVPHHLIDVVDPTERYSTGRWRDDAIRVIEDILQRRKVPLIVGGTMLYYRALVSGLDALPPADDAIRESITKEAVERGWPALHEELERVDPQSAQRIKPRDAQRIQRALEVFRVSGKPLSSLQGKSAAEPPFKVKAFALVPEREVLHRRIAERFDAMLAAGLLEELKNLRKQFHLSAVLPSMRSVGYRQAWRHLEGETDAGQMREEGIVATRQLAKRQITWLRSFALPAADPDPARLAQSFL